MDTTPQSVAWDGITRPGTLKDYYRGLRDQLADSARDFRWTDVLELLRKHPDLVNTTRLGGNSGYTPLHQAAYGGAPPEVAEELVRLGAWRTLRSADGQRAVDIARQRGHQHLTRLLEPVYRRKVAEQSLGEIQRHFHALILSRAAEMVERERLLEYDSAWFWFAIPGFYGGFSYWLEILWDGPLLVSESWCRVWGGSGQRHVISPYGSLLVDEGFV